MDHWFLLLLGPLSVHGVRMLPDDRMVGAAAVSDEFADVVGVGHHGRNIDGTELFSNAYGDDDRLAIHAGRSSRRTRLDRRSN